MTKGRFCFYIKPVSTSPDKRSQGNQTVSSWAFHSVGRGVYNPSAMKIQSGSDSEDLRWGKVGCLFPTDHVDLKGRQWDRRKEYPCTCCHYCRPKLWCNSSSLASCWWRTLLEVSKLHHSAPGIYTEQGSVLPHLLLQTDRYKPISYSYQLSSYWRLASQPL